MLLLSDVMSWHRYLKIVALGVYFWVYFHQLLGCSFGLWLPPFEGVLEVKEALTDRV